MTTLPKIRELHARSLQDAPTAAGWCAAYAQDVGVLLAEIDRLTAKPKIHPLPFAAPSTSAIVDGGKA